jgi:glutamate 5-kinase
MFGVRSEILKDITRIVVKLGTGVLTDSRKQPDLAQMEQLVAQIGEQRQAGREILVVSSGAVGAGMGALGYEKRPTELAELQACAAVGQSRLMAIYEKLFGTHGLSVAQILLTHDDLEHHERHLNARNTLVTLLNPRRRTDHQRERRRLLDRTEVWRQRQALRAGCLAAAGGFAGRPDQC